MFYCYKCKFQTCARKIQEIELLRLIYKDLAQRNKDMVIAKESFQDFFNMIGLWGEQVFDTFDKKHNNIIDYEEFISGIDFYIKCEEKDKIKHLFELYDLKKAGGIMKEEFQQMLMNYPKEDLKRLLDDPTFLEEQNILKMHKQKTQGVIKRENKALTHRRQSRQGVGIEISNGRRESRQAMSGKDLAEKGSSNESNVMNRQQSIDMMFPDESMIAQNGVPLGGIGCDLTLRNGGQVIQMRQVNLNYMVTKYIDMVFSENKQLLDQNEFTAFVSKHPNIFNGLYRGFNYNIWGFNRDLKEPRYQSMEVELESSLQKQSRKTKQLNTRICKLIAHFLLEFKTKGSRLPNQIICLDGLVVQEIINREMKQFGFQIFHKDKVYKSKTYFCKEEETYRMWTEKLACFQKASITDQYNLLEKIGEGRFSTVYKGQSKKDKSEFAVKIIEKFKLSREERMMLSHETEIMKLLNHACIIKLYETIETKTHLYIITELATDGDLFDFTAKCKYLQEYDAALIMSQLFDALSYIHQIGIVHRDLKPENIMVIFQADGLNIKQIKIIDFGFANFLANLQDPGELSEMLCGTTNYLAPETLEMQPVTFKVDNFALGVIMFKLITGVLPFDSQFPEEIIKNIAECKYEFDPDIWNTVSPDAQDLVSKLLQKEPSSRISLAQALKHPWIANRKQYQSKTRVIDSPSNALY